MPGIHKTIVLVFTFLFVIVIGRMIYHRKLREEYSWLWLLTCLFIIILTLFDSLLAALTNFFEIHVPTATLVLFGLFFLLAICFHFTLRLSDQTNNLKKLSQELTLLRGEYERSLTHSGENNKENPQKRIDGFE